MSKGHPEKRMILFCQVRRRLLITHFPKPKPALSRAVKPSRVDILLRI